MAEQLAQLLNTKIATLVQHHNELKQVEAARETNCQCSTLPPPGAGDVDRVGSRVCIERVRPLDDRDNYINIGGVTAFYRGAAYTPVGVDMPKSYASNHTGSGAIDGDPNTMAHTNNDPDVSITVNLGREVPVDLIVIDNRVDCCQFRLMRCRVALRTAANETVWETMIESTQQQYRLKVR